MFRLARMTIIGLLLGLAFILVFINFNTVKERVTDLISNFNRLPESFSLDNLLGGFEDEDNSIISQDNYVIKVMDSFGELSYFHDSNNSKSVSEICATALACINSGYFLEDQTHAGLLTIDGFKYVAIAPNDKQLSHVVRYKNSRLEFLENAQYSFDAESDFEFQAGPLLLDNGLVRTDLISSAPNGNQASFRSYIGITGEGKIFIGITTKQVDLKTLAESLKAILGEGLYVMNLDGGSSFSIFFQGSSLNSFGTSKILPNLLIFK